MHEFQTLPFLIWEKGKELAVSSARYKHYDNLTKVVLASLAGNFDWSEASRERQARASQEYRDHLELVYKYNEDMWTQSAELSCLQAEFEFQRSSNANRRAEINMR